MGQIYIAECTVNGKQYVGQTTFTMRKRKSEHECEAKRGCDMPFHRAIRKHGKKSFQWSIVVDNLDDGDLDQAEEAWIEHYNTLTENGGGYNCRGAGPGGRLSAQCKAKLAESQRRAAQRRRDNGYKYKSVPKSAETRAKIAQTMRTVKHSSETKTKMFSSRMANLTPTQRLFNEGKLQMGVVYLCEDGRFRKIVRAASARSGLVFPPCCKHGFVTPITCGCTRAP
ncbi:MAG: hypothetical protein CMJ19_14960 [Phycisphaeraceae bacterium]|nr:hypothetical protein [Phycisphaeraceae bacterium]